MIPVYRPHTFAADVLLAARDLLGWASSVIDEDLHVAETEEGQAVIALHDEAEGQIADLTTDPEGPDDPVRSVRAAIALLFLAEADDPGGGRDDIAALLDAKIRRRPLPPLPGSLTCADCDESFFATGGTSAADSEDRPLCPDCAPSAPGEAH